MKEFWERETSHVTHTQNRIMLNRKQRKVHNIYIPSHGNSQTNKENSKKKHTHAYTQIQAHTNKKEEKKGCQKGNRRKRIKTDIYLHTLPNKQNQGHAEITHRQKSYDKKE